MADMDGSGLATEANQLERKFGEVGDFSGDNEKEVAHAAEGADDNEGTDDDEGTGDDEDHDVDDDDEDSSDESYPGEDIQLPEFDSTLEVFNDDTYEDAEKRKIWARRHADTQEDGYNYRGALKRWQTVLDSNIEEHSFSTSRAQDNSNRLLREWWENKTYDRDVTHSIRNWIKEAADSYLDIVIQPRILNSTYNAVLFSLWREEYRAFMVSRYRPDNPAQIEPHRQVAALEAACHRITSSVLTLHNTNGTISNQYSTCSTTPLTANINPCGWLPLPEENTVLPYYLWDRQECRTILTHELPEHPVYMAISHTWGRWRTARSIPIPGVPWPVPGNTQFNVEALAGMLSEISFSERYIWLDLFCIPQTDPENDPRAKMEIANQAAIFKSATIAIAWLTTVPSWGGLQSTIELIALQFVGQDGGLELQEVIKLATEKAQKTTHLVVKDVRSKDVRDDVKGNLQPWFTSLWTLQELCLRPDMLLCDSSWRPFSIGHFKVPMDHIMALWQSKDHQRFLEAQPEDARMPTGWLELALVLVDTGIKELPEMSPMMVLVLGDLRMSVVGCRDWFINSTSQDPVGDDLMLGRYPFAFVQEARQKMKGLFFATVDQSPYGFSSSGTLLPFSRENKDGTMQSRSILAHEPSNVEDHPSVAYWALQPCGSVVLPEVGIAASFPRQKIKIVFANIIWPQWVQFTESPEEPEGLVDLNEFLASFWPDREKHAVYLMRSSGVLVTGIIIMEEKSPENNNLFEGTRKRIFAKLCNFWYLEEVESVGFPESEQVDWAVI
jgi:hypothetical protein